MTDRVRGEYSGPCSSAEASGQVTPFIVIGYFMVLIPEYLPNCCMGPCLGKGEGLPLDMGDFSWQMGLESSLTQCTCECGVPWCVQAAGHGWASASLGAFRVPGLVLSTDPARVGFWGPLEVPPPWGLGHSDRNFLQHCSA